MRPNQQRLGGVLAWCSILVSGLAWEREAGNPLLLRKPDGTVALVTDATGLNADFSRLRLEQWLNDPAVRPLLDGLGLTRLKRLEIVLAQVNGALSGNDRLPVRIGPQRPPDHILGGPEIQFQDTVTLGAQLAAT